MNDLEYERSFFFYISIVLISSFTVIYVFLLILGYAFRVEVRI